MTEPVVLEGKCSGRNKEPFYWLLLDLFLQPTERDAKSMHPAVLRARLGSLDTQQV